MSFQKPNEINVTPLTFELIWTAMIPDMSIQAMRWIKTVLPTSQTIVLISRIDEVIDARNTGANAITLKHQVIPFLTKLFSNMKGAVQMRAEATYPSRDAITN